MSSSFELSNLLSSYFVSIRQVLLAEKKLRVLNQQQMLNDAASDVLSNVDIAVGKQSVERSDVKWLANLLEFPEDTGMDQSEELCFIPFHI